MLICQVIELNPTPAQRDAFVSHAHAARIARNDVIALWREESKRMPGFRLKTGQLRPWVNRDKFDRHPWFRDLSQNAVKGGAIDAEDAIKRFYKGQNRRPRFLGRTSALRFRIDNGVDTVKVADGRLVLPKIGNVKLKESLRWDRPIRECRIREKAGRWYASVGLDIDASEYPHRCGQGVLGVDLGLRTFATIAYPDGTIEKIDALEPFKRSRRALRRAQRKLSRRKKGGKNWLKAKKDVARRHRRMTDTRKDFLHQLSHKLTAHVEVIQVESLSVKGWQRRWGRKTSDLAPGELLRQLEYKATWRGGQLIKADWHFPSTQICHDCGAQSGRLRLSVRRWTCVSCGSIHDRDGNAALNIRDYGPGAHRSLPVDDTVRPAMPAAVGGSRNSADGDANDVGELYQVREQWNTTDSTGVETNRFGKFHQI